MKALGVSAAPRGTWQCEIKFDGYRAVALLNDGKVELWSRNERSMTADYPEVVAALGRLKCRDAVLDGEVVALDPAGRSRFQLLQSREHSDTRPLIVYYVFDVMRLNGEDVRSRPLEERRELLEKAVKKAERPVQLSPVFTTEPVALLTEIEKQGLEGIIAKRPGSAYESDRRSGAWVKCKIFNEQEFVIGGYTAPRNSRQHFGAVLVGHYRDGKLLYAGKVGTGFDARRLESIHEQFARRVQRECPFDNLPLPRRPRFGTGMTAAEMKRVTWLHPDLVAQVRFGEWTQDGLLRQPVFLGLRRDKAARDVRREAARAA